MSIPVVRRSFSIPQLVVRMQLRIGRHGNLVGRAFELRQSTRWFVRRRAVAVIAWPHQIGHALVLSRHLQNRTNSGMGNSSISVTLHPVTEQLVWMLH